jgi:hypothetical protein
MTDAELCKLPHDEFLRLVKGGGDRDFRTRLWGMIHARECLAAEAEAAAEPETAGTTDIL